MGVDAVVLFVIMLSSFCIIHPVASVLEMRCEEYLRLFFTSSGVSVWVCMCIYVLADMHIYISIHISTQLQHSILVDRILPLMSALCDPLFSSHCAFLAASIYRVSVHPT